MTSLLRRVLPISAPRICDVDEYNLEYSFAMEYSGPPISYDIPEAAPIDFGHIPTASAVSLEYTGHSISYDIPHVTPVDVGRIPTASLTSSNISLPSVRLRPIVKSASLKKELPNEEILGSAQVPESRSGVLCSPHGDEDSPRIYDGNGSSGTLEFSNGGDISGELSGSSDVDGLRDGAHSHDNRTQLVTFGEPESLDILQEESDVDEQEIFIQERRHAVSRVKKGSCHRCLKGNRFTEKEICLVCNAKYCSHCVLRAMGSMPEGRKCITCIGSGIYESKRGNLGKCSRMLKRLLADWEVKQRMHVEVSCQANQLPPSLIIVNGRSISVEELVLLQSCVNPPKRLRPGS